jgi:hypothetical protein
MDVRTQVKLVRLANTLWGKRTRYHPISWPVDGILSAEVRTASTFVIMLILLKMVYIPSNRFSDGYLYLS